MIKLYFDWEKDYYVPKAANLKWERTLSCFWHLASKRCCFLHYCIFLINKPHLRLDILSALKCGLCWLVLFFIFKTNYCPWEFLLEKDGGREVKSASFILNTFFFFFSVLYFLKNNFVPKLLTANFPVVDCE